MFSLPMAGSVSSCENSVVSHRVQYWVPSPLPIFHSLKCNVQFHCYTQIYLPIRLWPCQLGNPFQVPFRNKMLTPNKSQYLRSLYLIPPAKGTQTMANQSELTNNVKPAVRSVLIFWSPGDSCAATFSSQGIHFSHRSRETSSDFYFLPAWLL